MGSVEIAPALHDAEADADTDVDELDEVDILVVFVGDVVAVFAPLALLDELPAPSLVGIELSGTMSMTGLVESLVQASSVASSLHEPSAK